MRARWVWPFSPSMRSSVNPLFALALFFLFSVPAATAQQIVGHWKFDEGSVNVAHDSSGKNNQGEIVGAKWTSGPSSGSAALAFRDHASESPSLREPSYVRVKNNESLNPTKGFEISANVFIDPSFSPSFAATIVDKGGGYGCSYRLLITSDFKLEAVAGNEHALLLSSTKVPLGKWFSAKATFDGRILKVYVDGKEDGSVALQTRNLSSQEDVVIGQRFTGKLANILIITE